MTADRLATIRARLEAATPGPWEHDLTSVWTMADSCAGGPVAFAGDDYPRGDNHPTENMTFIANAHSDIAYLLARVQQLEEVARAAWEVVGDFDAHEGVELAHLRAALADSEPEEGK